jgi:hypothetical protein
MTTTITRNDPAKAKEFFEAKMAFTTGPIELEQHRLPLYDSTLAYAAARKRP